MLLRKTIAPASLNANPVTLWNNQWFVLAAGDFKSGDYNVMTVAWGGIGVMWGKPFVHIVVRPVRHTFGFIERYDTFTLCAFPEICRESVRLLGSKSGRDTEKLKESGLTPMAAQTVNAPVFCEAELIIECRKIYRDQIKPENFLDQEIDKQYPRKDYHYIYYGQMLHVEGVERFCFSQQSGEK